MSPEIHQNAASMSTWMIRSCSDGTRLQTDLLSLLRCHQMVRHVESDGPTRLRSPSAGEARPASARPTTVRGGSPAGRAPSGPRASRSQAGRGLVRGLRGARGEAVHGALELLERPNEVDAPRGSSAPGSRGIGATGHAAAWQLKTYGTHHIRRPPGTGHRQPHVGHA